jgi:acyl-coenzyme A thioesterase PaaI-like protein
MTWNATPVEDGLERLRRWTDEHRGVPPAFGRMRCSFDEVAPARTVVRLPLVPELLLPDGSSTAAVTAMLCDLGLASSVIASLPDLRGVATVSFGVDHLALPPVTGALVVTCTATPYDGGRPQHASGQVHDDAGRLVAQLSGWLMPTPAEPSGVERVGLVHEPAAEDLLDLLGVPAGQAFSLTARDALSNAIGSLHGGVGAMACSLAAEAALPGMRPLTSSFAFLRPTPPEGSVEVCGTAVRRGRRTGAASATVTDNAGRLLVQAHLVAVARD